MSIQLHFSGQKSNPEFQSAVVRLSIWLFMLAYIGLGAATENLHVKMEEYYTLFSVFLVIFIGLFISVLIRPVYLERQYFGLAMDIGATSFAVFLTQNTHTPILLLYVWIFISYGTRYGKDHLIAATVVSIMAYSAVMIEMGGWRNNLFETSFFLIFLTLLPIYQYSLLKKLHDARLEAEAATIARGRFLANMTHELRTPLSGLIGMSNVMDTSNLTALQSEQLEAIRRSGDKLQQLIGDVLDFSKIDANKLELDKQSFNVAETALRVCQTLALQASEKGLETILDIDDNVPLSVIGDKLRVSQIITNLVSNAVKFTNKGEIYISLSVQQAADNRLEKTSDNEIELLIRVKDTGIGIDNDKLQSVFDVFVQMEGTNTQEYSAAGAGLGMAISKNLVSLMNGHIDVKSVPNEGTEFLVYLPLIIDETASVELMDLSGIHILLVETNELLLNRTKQTAEQLGLEVTAISNIRQLTDLSLKNNIDVLVFADSLRGMNLVDIHEVTLELLKKSIPSVFITYPGKKNVNLPQGAISLNKPFSTREFYDVVNQALSVSEKPQIQQRGSGKKTFSKSKNILVAEDDHISAQLISTLLANAGHTIEIFSDGFSALQAIRTGRYDMAFIDIRMPDMDGIELTRIIRNEITVVKDIPIFAITASVSEETRKRSKEAGISEFLVKPISAEVIQSIMNQYC